MIEYKENVTNLKSEIGMICQFCLQEDLASTVHKLNSSEMYYKDDCDKCENDLIERLTIYQCSNAHRFTRSTIFCRFCDVVV